MMCTTAFLDVTGRTWLLVLVSTVLFIVSAFICKVHSQVSPAQIVFREWTWPAFYWSILHQQLSPVIFPPLKIKTSLLPTFSIYHSIFSDCLTHIHVERHTLSYYYKSISQLKFLRSLFTSVCMHACKHTYSVSLTHKPVRCAQKQITSCQ